MTQHQIHQEVERRIGVVTFDHATRHNCFTDAALSDLVDALEAVAAIPEVMVIRLEMAGPTFCSGWDTRSFGELATHPAETIEQNLRNNDDKLRRIRNLPVPVVAAVRGQAAGFGVGLLASIQLPIVAADATATLPEVAYGISPAGVLKTVLDRLPIPVARHMVLTGSRITANQLLNWGLAAEVAPPAELDDAVTATVASIAEAPGDVIRTITDSISACTTTDSDAPAYAAAARSIVALNSGAAL